jgi:hypothetical protein
MLWIFLESEWSRGLVADQMLAHREQLRRAGHAVSVQPWPLGDETHPLVLWRLFRGLRTGGRIGVVFDHVPSAWLLWGVARFTRECVVWGWHPPRRRPMTLPKNVTMHFPTPEIARWWRQAGWPTSVERVVPPPAPAPRATGEPRHRYIGRRVICSVGPDETHAALQAIWTLNILSYVDPNLRLVLHGLGRNVERCREFAASIGMVERSIFAPQGSAWEETLAQADVVWVPTPAAAVGDLTRIALAWGQPLVLHPRVAEAGLVPPSPRCHRVRHDTPPGWAAVTLQVLQSLAGEQALAATSGAWTWAA